MNTVVPNIKNMVSQFNLSHSRQMTLDMAKLVPCLCEEIYPGDSWNLTTDILVKLMPLATPAFAEIYCYVHYFFVPNRIIFEDWEDFITGGSDGADTTVYPKVRMQTGYREEVANGDLADYLGFPEGGDNSPYYSALPFRAYATIYNEWYRDQNLQTKLTVSTAAGVDTTTSIDLQTRCWEKNYFTSALASPQKGTAVSLPLGTSAPLSASSAWVKGIGVEESVSGTTLNVDVHESDGTSPTYGTAHNFSTGDLMWTNASSTGDRQPIIYADLSSVTADLSTATAATINDFRSALALQKFMEKNNRGGSRYAESLLVHYGVTSSDARQMRPEYLGGGKAPIMISEVLQTSQSDTTKQGHQTGQGTSAMQGVGFKKSFNEHGWLLGILSIQPRHQISQGKRRQFNRETRYDYMFPTFWNLGEQAIENQELYIDHTNPTSTFGYAPRFQELREIPSSFHGEFRDTASYANWHMGTIYTSDINLGSSFVTCTPTTRIFQNTSAHTCNVSMRHNISALRCLPKYAVPSL